MEIEKVKPDFIAPDKGVIIPEHYIFRTQSGSNRYYGLSINEEMSEPKYAPGVTSVLHATMPMAYGLIKWREQHGEQYCDWFMESSSAYGTWLHGVYGRLMRGEELQFARESLMSDFALFVQIKGGDWKSIERWVKSEGRNPQKDIYGFITWFKEWEVVPIAIEYPLFFDLSSVIEGSLPYAGTIDLICEMKSKKKDAPKEIAIVDFKTGYNVYESHAVQLRAYKDGWNMLECGPAVTETYNLTSKDYNIPLGKTAQPYSLRRQTDNKAGELWPLYLEMFYAKYPEIVLQNTFFTEQVVSIKKSDNIILEGKNEEGNL